MIVFSDVETIGPDGKGRLDYWDPTFRVSHQGIIGPNPGDQPIVYDPNNTGVLTSPWSIGFDRHVVHNAGFEGAIYPKGTAFEADTMILCHLIDPSLPTDLETRLWEHLGIPPWKGNEQTWGDWAIRCSTDVVNTRDLYNWCMARITPRAKELHDKVLLPANVIYGRSRHRGIHIDVKYRDVLRADLEAEKARLGAEIQHYGFKGNINSSQQLGKFLYGELDLPRPPKKRDAKTDNPTTGDEYLAELSGLHPVVKAIRAYRTCSRNLSTYMYPTDIIRPGFLIAHTITGRAQATKPNVMNVPRLDKAGRFNFRKLYVAPPGHLIVSGDLSQVELRLMAYFSRDPEMTRLFMEGVDIHMLLACKLTGKQAKDVTSDERTYAKNINFAYLYGASPRRVRQMLLTEQGIRISLSEAEHAHRTYFRLFPGVKEYQESMARQVLLHHHTTSPSGRRWDHPNSRAREQWKQTAACRDGVNYRSQGTGFDLCAIGLVGADRLLQGAPFITIHDQVASYVPALDATDFAKTWADEWERDMAAWLPDCPIKFKVDIGIGASLGELVKVKR